MSCTSREIILISDVHNIRTSIFIDTILSVCHIFKIFEKQYNIPNETFFLVSEGKILSKWNNIYPTGDRIQIELIPKMKGGIFGGIGDILDDVKDLIDDAINSLKDFIMGIINTIVDGFLYIFNQIMNYVINPIISVFMIIKNVFEQMIKFFIYLVNVFIWFGNVVAWVFTEILNLPLFFTDFLKALMTVIYAMFSTVVNIALIFFETSVNSVGNLVSGSFWGWDQSITSPVDKQSDYFKKQKKCKNKKCYLNQDNKVPFSVILGTILCPPLGVFMEYGITGWFNILICAVLTIFFYFPGLFYALLIIYNT
jgi:uncharacterized membrane protein YqaE (UPF0057 family)